MISNDTLGTILVFGGGIIIQLLINRSNRQGQAATSAIEEKRVELDGKKVDLEVLTDSIVNLREDLKAEREARIKSDRRAVAAEERADRAEERADRAERKTDALAASLAAHGQWDLLVLAEVRKSNQDFPDPPPLALPELL